MLRLAATLMLLLQLRPVAGAAVCVFRANSPDANCEMSMPGMPSHHEAGTPGSTHTPGAPSDCPVAQLCAVAPGAVLSIAATTTIPTLETSRSATPYTNSFVATDPAAPLDPPPNT